MPQAPDTPASTDGEGPVTRVRLIRIAAVLLKDSEAAEDIVQDVYLKVLRRFGSLELVSSSYLTCAVRHAALNRIRSLQVESRAKLQFGLPSGSDTQHPNEQVQAAQELTAILEAIDELPPRSKLVARMHWLEGASCRTIASRLGITPKAVEKRITFARRAVRKMLSSRKT